MNRNALLRKLLPLGATALAVFALAPLAHAQSHTKVIDFDTDAQGNAIAEGDTIAEQYAAWGIHFEANVFGGINYTGSPFATNTDMTATATDWGFVDTTQPTPTGNLLGSLTGYSGSNGDPNFWIRLDKPVNIVSMDVYGDGTFFGSATLYGFDQNLNLIDIGIINEYDGQETMSLPVSAGYSYIAFVGDSDYGLNDAWTGVDNIRLTAAPEPGTVALLATGLLPIAGVVIRRRKVA